MRKVKLLELISNILFLSTFVLYYCYNSVEFAGNYLYYFPIVLLSLISIARLFKKKLKLDDAKHFFWYVLFFLIGLLSLIWSINRSYSLVVLKRVFITVLWIFSLTVYIDTEVKTKKIIKYNLFGLICMILLLIIKESGKTYFYGNIIGFHRNSIAISLIFGTVQLYYIYIKEKNKKILLLFPTFLYVIYKTGSRKSIIFIFLFLIFELLISQGKNVKKIVKNILIIGGIIFICYYVLNSNELLRIRMSDMFRSFFGESVQDLSVIERKYYRDLAFSLFKNKPLLGYGIFGFAAYLNNIGYSHIAYCHCNWLELLSTLGIVGFIVYYSQYFKIFIKSINLFKHNEIDTTIPLIVIVLLFAIEYGLVSYYTIEINLMLFIIFKMLSIYERSNYNENKR